MNSTVIGAIVLNEVRLRTRRLSTLFALLAVVAVTWMMVADPSSGKTMIAANHVRALYNSTALSVGSGVLATFLFGLGSFYLVRGRTREDLQHGMGAVLAATPVGNATLLFARWLGGVAYLCVLIFALMLTVMVLQLVHGEATVEPLVYVQMYGLLLLPTVFFAVGIAVLCDAFSPLMGKLGDVLYFLLWVGQFSAMPSAVDKNPERFGWIASVDLSGLATIVHRFKEVYATDSFNIGGAAFDYAATPFVMSDFWTWEMIGMRFVCMAIALLPLLPAILVFHRFSPDRVKAANAARRTSVVAFLNRVLRPLTVVVRPLMALAARLPGIWGQATADLALTLLSNPLAVAAIPVFVLVGALAGTDGMRGALFGAAVCWGILISDLSVRDYQAATESLTAAVPGGASRRYLRHLSIAVLLGLVISASVLLRWIIAEPLGAAALVTGFFALAAVAALLGRSTRTGRTFLALFLFGMYMSSQIKTVQWFDVVGANGVATPLSVSVQLCCGVVAVAIGWKLNQRRNG